MNARTWVRDESCRDPSPLRREEVRQRREEVGAKVRCRYVMSFSGAVAGVSQEILV